MARVLATWMTSKKRRTLQSTPWGSPKRSAPAHYRALTQLHARSLRANARDFSDRLPRYRIPPPRPPQTTNSSAISYLTKYRHIENMRRPRQQEQAKLRGFVLSRDRIFLTIGEPRQIITGYDARLCDLDKPQRLKYVAIDTMGPVKLRETRAKRHTYPSS